MQVPPSLQRQIRIVELLLYLPSCKMVQVLSDAWDHSKNCTNTNSIQSYHLHIHVTVKIVNVKANTVSLTYQDILHDLQQLVHPLAHP